MRFSTFIISLALFLLAFPTMSRAQNNGHPHSPIMLSINVNEGNYRPAKVSYLGTQIGGGPNVFNFVQTGDNQKFVSNGLSIGYQPSVSALKDYIFSFSFSNFIAYQSENFGTLDPAGGTLLIAGVGVGATGVGFGLPGPNNQITEGAYKSTLDGYDVALGVKRSMALLDDRLTVSPSVGLQYKKLWSQNILSGNIPFFVRQFGYDTKLNIESFSPTLGLDLNYMIDSGISIFGGVQYVYDFNNGKGYDSLAFTGFDTQTLRLSNDKRTDSHKAHLGVSYTFQNSITFSLEGHYQSLGNTPLLDVRTSIAPVRFSYKKSEIYSAGLKLSYRF